MKYLFLLILSLAYSQFKLVVSAQSCSSQSPQTCLSPQNPCKYDFTANTCVAQSATPDSCQGFTTQGTCPSSCFWDGPLSRCVPNLYVIVATLGCPYFSTSQFLSADTSGNGIYQSYACGYHGCSFNANTGICYTPTSSGSIAYPQPSTVSGYQNYIYFLNPTIVQNSLTCGITVATLISQSITSPQWPVISIATPQSNISSIYGIQNVSCSSYNNSASAGPVPFLSSSYPASTSNIQAAFPNNFQFANDSSTGTYLQKLLGYASVAQNSNYLVKSVSSDGTYIYWTLSFDLTALAQNCQSRGVSISTTPTGRTYFVPISLLDRTPTGFFSSSQNFYVNVPTTGAITISDTSVYHLRSYIIESTFQQSTCPSGQLKQFITWEFDVRDQFDPTKYVGPRNIADIFVRNPQTNALASCYGETLSNFNFLGCSVGSATCAFQFQTTSRCRTIQPDGNAFNFCNYSLNADRISDMGGDVNYPTAMDGYHSLWVNSYACTAGTSPLAGCLLANQNSNNYADQIQATIKDSAYNSAVTINANPFQVFAGFLPYPTAGISSFQPLTSTNGTANGTQYFDGNLFVGQPITPIIYLTSALQSTVDLRLLVANTNLTIYALDSFGNRMTGAAVTKLDFTTFQNSLLYSPKNVYDNTALCGASGQYCQKLPACNNIIGCDGISFSSVILKNAMPAIGYQFVFQFAEGLPNINGQPANARLMQSYNPDDNSAPDPNANPSGVTHGQISFTIRLIDKADNKTYNVEIIQNMGFFQMLHQPDTIKSFFIACVPFIISNLILVWSLFFITKKYVRHEFEIISPQLLPQKPKKQVKFTIDS